MTMKCHCYIQQTNPGQREEEARNADSNTTAKHNDDDINST